jgi:DNA repair protein RadC
MNVAIRDMPKTERPRERFMSVGPQSLAVHELIEIIFGSGNSGSPVPAISGSLLVKYDTLERIDTASLAELCTVRGLGQAKALKLKAALELGKRFNWEHVFPASSAVITTEDADRLARCHFKNKKKEHLMLFCLDVRGKLISAPEVISVGILDCSLVHPREVFKSAIGAHASKIMLAHNHPSGSSAPSDADIEVTQQIYGAGKIVGIELIDHIVLGADSFTSIRQAEPDIFT